MKYQLQGYEGSTDRGYDAERFADTLRDAKTEAKYMLSEAYRLASEASRRLVTVQIWKGELLMDEISEPWTPETARRRVGGTWGT